MERPTWAPGEIDPDRPSVARVYDYYLGGAHNFAVDRAVADATLQALPEIRNVLRMNRMFLGRAVRHLVDAGIRQFLDLGSGIPTAGNVHEIALAAAGESRVVYVDVDPVAVAHSRALLAGNDQVAVLRADVRKPAEVLGSPEVQGVLDLSQPVAVLMIAVLHFMPDSDDPDGVIAEYLDGVTPGSYLAVSHAGYDGDVPPAFGRAQRLYNSSVAPMTLRNSARIREFFTGLELVEPGVAPIPQWLPDELAEPDGPAPQFSGWAAIGRKP